MTMTTRGMQQKIHDYYTQVIDEEDYSAPDADTVRAISVACTNSAKKAFNEFNTTFSASPEKARAINVLSQRRNRLCGQFQRRPLLGNLAPMEQMAVVKDWTQQSNPRQIHTFSLEQQGEDGNADFIPVTVKPPRGNKATNSYHIVLGATQGAHEAPVYSKWAETDPRQTAQEVFIKPLNALETVRAEGDPALAMKAPFFEADGIDENARYAPTNPQGDPEPKASVELPKQQQKKTIRARHELAPGKNLTAWIGDGALRDANMIPEICYEDYTDEDAGYNDDGARVITPLNLVEALGPIARSGDTGELDEAMRALSALQIGKSQIPVVRDFTVNRLFE